ncbi:MAG TPA: hypothetical protein VFZ48_05550 [Candidatus Saccharimonadales bacterium]
MSTEAVYEEVFKHHNPNIHIGQSRTPAVIVFSAVPGSGKSDC